MAPRLFVNRQPEPQPAAEEPAAPRFEHPKVMCIDLSHEDVETIRAAGYRVTEGTLGTPYAVERLDRLVQPYRNDDLSGLVEQEVVVIQHAMTAVSPNPTGDAPASTNEDTLWATCRRGVVDARPFAAQLARSHVERIVEYGGVVICFAAATGWSGLLWGSAGGYGAVQELDISTWRMVPALDYFEFQAMEGEEIQVSAGAGRLDPLTPHLQSASFLCTIRPYAGQQPHWHSLATNKFGDDVAGLLLPSDESRKGFTFVLPQVKDPGAAVQVLLDDILPELVPALFPASEKFGWRERAPYALPEVEQLREKIDRVRSEAAEQEAELQAAIEAVQEESGWLLDLLTGTSTELVDAVEKALEELGLPEVKKVDEVEEARAQGRLREDIQVLGGSPVIQVEVKGISGLPKEEDSLAVTKYRAPRMEEWDRTDIRGLAVINHQRNLPPLERENVHTFQEDVLDNTKEFRFAVITGFDLFRLTTNKRTLGWPEEAVVPLFYEDGRIGVIPTHYEFVGVVDHFYDQAGVIAVTVEGSGFNVGDRLGYELPIAFKEEEVASMQLDNADLTEARAGQRVGIKTSLGKHEARSGLRVYRVGSSVPLDTPNT